MLYEQPCQGLDDMTFLDILKWLPILSNPELPSGFTWHSDRLSSQVLIPKSMCIQIGLFLLVGIHSLAAMSCSTKVPMWRDKSIFSNVFRKTDFLSLYSLFNCMVYHMLHTKKVQFRISGKPYCFIVLSDVSKALVCHLWWRLYHGGYDCVSAPPRLGRGAAYWGTTCYSS